MKPETELLFLIAEGRANLSDITTLDAKKLIEKGYIKYVGSRAVITPTGERRMGAALRMSGSRRKH